jgi:hypothetical protein
MPPPHDDRAEPRAKINAEFIQVDQALRALLVAHGQQPGGHPRINSTLAEDAGLITHHIARAIRNLILLVDLANLDFDLDMAWFLVKEYHRVTHEVLAAL